MYELFLRLLDFIFPPSEDLQNVRSLTRADMSVLLTPSIVNGVRVLASYTNPYIHSLIHEAKFHGNSHAFSLLNTLIAHYITEYLPEHNQIIIPIPLSSTRLRARGYNQVYEILRAGTSLRTSKISKDILIRTRDTRPQTELKRIDRLQNMRDAFRVLNSESVLDKHIVLVDDVLTTGATLDSAKKALLAYSPASITCIAIAH